MHLLEQRGVGSFFSLVKQINALDPKPLTAGLRIVEHIELSDEVAPLAPPGRQQGVGLGVHVFQCQRGEVAARAQRLSATQRMQQLAPVHDVAPIKAAGVGNGQNHLAVRCQGGQ